jgi:hypothetical protein
MYFEGARRIRGLLHEPASVPITTVRDSFTDDTLHGKVRIATLGPRGMGVPRGVGVPAFIGRTSVELEPHPTPTSSKVNITAR